jgi:solute:Na+ symporter, SSS family
MGLPIVDLIVFLVVTGGTVLLGCSFFFRSKSTESFTAAGGAMPGWLVGMSIFATFVSSISFLGLPGKAFQSDWNAFVFSLSIPVASIVAARFFVPLYRSVNSVSAYQYLEIRFGYWARAYASICYLLTQITRTGAILYLLALPLHTMLGWDISAIIIVAGISVILYSMLGGIAAVIWTDAVQGFILIAGALACALILTFSMPEGPGQLFNIAMEHHKFSLGSLSPSLSDSTFWVVLVYGLFINLQNFGIDQNYVQRYLTAKNEKSAKFSALFGGMLYLPVSFLFFYIGTALFAYYTAKPNLLPPGTVSDNVFPYFIVHGLPAGMTGLVIAAIFAAGMSTIATSLNSGATIILTDFFKRFDNGRLTDRQSMRILYAFSLLMGLFGISVALAMIKVQSALDAWWTLASIFSGGMLGLFLLGYISKNVTSVQAAVGVTVGVILIAWMSLSPIYFTTERLMRFRSPFHGYLTIVFGTAVIFLVGFLLQVCLRERRSND